MRILRILLALACGATTATAAQVNLTASDAANTSSLTSAGNWDNLQAPLPLHQYFVGSSFTLRTPTNQDPAVTFAGGPLTLAGVFAFKMTNLVTVPELRLSNGTVANYFAGGNPNAGRLGGVMQVITNGSIDAGGAGLSMEIHARVEGNGNLSVRRPDFVTFHASNTFSGSLTLQGTTVEIPAGGVLRPSSLVLQYLGSSGVVGVTNKVKPGGRLDVGYGPGGVLRVGARTSGGTNSIAVLDVSAQSDFVVDVGEFAIGLNQFNDSLLSVAHVYLATNNHLRSTQFVIGDSAFNPGGTSTMRFGSGSNYVETPLWRVGARKQSAQVTLPAGALLRTDAGANRAEVQVAVQDFNTSATPASSLNLAGGWMARLGTLTVARKTGGNTGGSTGTLLISGDPRNDVDVDELVIGSLEGASSGAAAVTGTLEFGGGTFRVNNDVVLANRADDNGLVQGTLRIQGGTFLVGGDIVDGAGTSTLEVNGGVLDVSGSGGSVTADSLVLNGVLANASSVNVRNLSGAGSLQTPGAVTVVTGTLAPGQGGIGLLTVQGALKLSGTTVMEWNKDGSGVVHDSVQGFSSVVFGGTLILTNSTGAALAPGDSMKLFDGGSGTGLFATVIPNSPGPNLLWDTSTLHVDGTLRVVEVPGLSGSVAGNQLQLKLSGAPGQLYGVLTSTNLTLPLSQWSVWTNGVFAASPLSLPAIPANEPKRFFQSTAPGYIARIQPYMVEASTKPTGASWNFYSTRTLDQLPAAVQMKSDTGFGLYGGLLSRQTNATGFFYPLKIDQRWWLVDPQGYLFLHRGVAVISTVDSPGAQAALQAKFGSTANWAAATTSLLRQHQFNGAGAWSDTTRLRAVNPPLVYTIIVNFMDTYSGTNSHPGYPYVFDPGFATFCDKRAQQFANTKTDPWLLGYFSDNELPFPSTMLTTFLGLTPGNASYEAAWAWLRARYGPGATVGQVTTQDRNDFLGYVWGEYYRIVSQAIKKYDPNHLYLGTRFYSTDKDRPEIFRAIGPYVDVVSVNHYGQWTPDIQRIRMWERESGRPVIISEWYVKGIDSGMPNTTGAGWVVHTQKERGLFYENFALALLESKVCVGWHWFKYADNDPDAGADPSNIDSNKGVVSNRYDPYFDLLRAARRINERAHRLADYFDGTIVP